MSLRIRMQTLSPCLTASRCKPPAMRAPRSATSAWSRRRSPLMMPRKSGGVSTIVFSDLSSGYDTLMVRSASSRLSNHEGMSDLILRDATKTSLLRMRFEYCSNIRETRRAFLDIGTDRLELVGAAHQFHLLDRFG